MKASGKLCEEQRNKQPVVLFNVQEVEHLHSSPLITLQRLITPGWKLARSSSQFKYHLWLYSLLPPLDASTRTAYHHTPGNMLRLAIAYSESMAATCTPSTVSGSTDV
jgi:hypothetical protein